MFLCKRCQLPGDFVGFSKSHGSCESCGIVSTCHDVKIHRAEPAEKIRDKEVPHLSLNESLRSQIPKRTNYQSNKKWGLAYIRFKNLIRSNIQKGKYSSFLGLIQSRVDLKKIFSRG